MIAVDTNVLVYAHRADSDHHDRAVRALAELTASSQPWAIPWPCAHEFYSTVTHPRVFDPPTSVESALDAISALVEDPRVRFLTEASGHGATLIDLLRRGGVSGPRVHDARIAAICLSHGISTLWTADRDFSYFPQLATHNPLVAA